ncbi:MAG: hypothetical protein KGZ88_22280 [Methylomicrobium sp.]|nr:hypothetical protein [Methylomicrobium sp.]
MPAIELHSVAGMVRSYDKAYRFIVMADMPCRLWLAVASPTFQLMVDLQKACNKYGKSGIKQPGLKHVNNTYIY